MQQTGSKAASRVYSYTSRGDDRSAHEAGGQALAAVVEDEADVGGEDQVGAEAGGGLEVGEPADEGAALLRGRHA